MFSDPRLTPDNPQLSRATMALEGPVTSAVNCTERHADEVERLVAASLSENTRRAYRADLAHFEAWGGHLPASPEVVASYLAAHSRTLAVATIVRRVATLSKAHEALGALNPCRSELVRATVRGIKRTRGRAQAQAKALIRDDLFLVLDQIGDEIRDARDRALLLIGFAGGLRRSELVAVDVGDIEFFGQGIVLTLRFSKTDQEGIGRKIGIPHGRTRHCPVEALCRWLSAARITTGPLFRPVDRHGHVAGERISGDAVSVILRERLRKVNLNPTGFSGHSLRAGFATSAARAGVSSLRIRAQTGHASDEMVARYVRDGELFSDNAAGALL